MRKNALAWWRGLSEEEQKEVASVYLPRYTFVEITSSSSRIEQIYKQVKDEE